MAYRVGCTGLRRGRKVWRRGKLHSCSQERCNSFCFTEQLLARKGFIPGPRVWCPCGLYTSHIIDVAINSPFQQVVREGVTERSLLTETEPGRLQGASRLATSGSAKLSSPSLSGLKFSPCVNQVHATHLPKSANPGCDTLLDGCASFWAGSLSRYYWKAAPL